MRLGRDVKEIAERTCRGGRDRELGNGVVACRVDMPDLVAVDLGEPELVIRPHGDVVRLAVGRGDWVFGDGSGWGDAADLVAVDLGEPEVAVGPGGDADGPAAGRRTGNSRILPD